MNELLYRYINWNDSGSKRLLSENELYFYSAQTWEKDGEYQFDLADYTEQRVFDIVLDIAIDMHNTNHDEYVLWMNMNAQKYGIDLNKLSSTEIDIVDQHFALQIAKERASNPSEFIKVQKQLYFDQTGIISMSKSKYSYNLWNSKRNSDGDNIVCVGLDLELLKESFKNIPNCFMSEIIYSDQKQKYQLIFDKTGYKSLLQLLDISYNLNTIHKPEAEVRLQRLLLDNSSDNQERKIVLPINIIKEIIVLKDADAATQSEIQNIAKQKGISKVHTANILHDDNAVSIV